MKWILSGLIIFVLIWIFSPIVFDRSCPSRGLATRDLTARLQVACQLLKLNNLECPRESPDQYIYLRTGGAYDWAPYFENNEQNLNIDQLLAGADIDKEGRLLDEFGNPIWYVLGNNQRKEGPLPKDTNKPLFADIPASDSDWNTENMGGFPYIWSGGESGVEHPEGWIYLKN